MPDRPPARLWTIFARVDLGLLKSVSVSVSVSVCVSVSLAWEQGHGRAQADTGPQTLPDQQRSCPCLSFVFRWFPSSTSLTCLLEPWRRQAY